jgi:hypothetical protein
VDAASNTSFSDTPDEEITPFEYFKCVETKWLKTSSSSPICIVYRKQEGHWTHKNEIEQFLGIHIMAEIVNMPSYRMYWADSTRFDPTVDVDTMKLFSHKWHKSSFREIEVKE